MKRYLLLLLPVSFLFSGCGGWMRYMEDRVIGSWRLSSAAKHQSFKKDPIVTHFIEKWCCIQGIATHAAFVHAE